MNKLHHLKECKRFLTKVVKQRRDLLRMGKGKGITATMQTDMPKIEYHAANINSFDRMMNYIGQSTVQASIFNLIPSNKNAWKAEFTGLLHIGKALQQTNTEQHQTTNQFVL